MKLAALAVVTLLGLGGAAHAQPAQPPEPAPRAEPAPGVAVAPRYPAERPARPRGELRQAVLHKFDRNHDGRLEPDERRRAARALRKLARRMEREDRRAEPAVRANRRAELNRRLVQRYDANGDGVVGPEEMPPGLARKLQRLDRNHDGWLDDRDRQ